MQRPPGACSDAMQRWLSSEWDGALSSPCQTQLERSQISHPRSLLARSTSNSLLTLPTLPIHTYPIPIDTVNNALPPTPLRLVSRTTRVPLLQAVEPCWLPRFASRP